MDLTKFNTPQEILPWKNPVATRWVIAIDIGFSSVKGVAPNKVFCFPSYIKKLDDEQMQPEKDDIYYRDDDGVYLIGISAQELVRADDTNDTGSSFDRNRYFTKDFLILARTAMAIGLMDNAERINKFNLRPYIQTGLPAAYLKEDAMKIKRAFITPGSFEIKIGNGKWKKYENLVNESDVSVMSQPAGTLNSIMIDDNGVYRNDLKKIISEGILIADVGFGTFDPYGIVSRRVVLQESINNLGMKKVLETASEYIYKDHGMDIRIPQMRKYMKAGYFTVIDIQNMKSQKVALDDYIEKACREVAVMAAKKLYEMAGYFHDYSVLVVTGGTGAAWIDYFRETFAGLDSLQILPGNNGNNLAIYYANARGYYMSAITRLKKGVKSS